MIKKVLILLLITSSFLCTIKKEKATSQISRELTQIPKLLQSIFTESTPELITWKNDSNWEKRFFNLKSAQDVTLRYFDLLLDTYASEIMNSCIKIFKSDWEKKETVLSEKLENLMEYFNLKKEDVNFKKNDEYKNNKNLYKKIGGDLQKAFSEFEIITGFCYDYFLYIKNFSFLTKYFFDSKYNLVYFKLHVSDKKIENMQIFKFFIGKLTESIEVDNFFDVVDLDHQKIFYIIYNHFVSAIELKRKIKEF